ncbi:hypothetical protein PC121_g795 [Phytophthora cactorum]|nr:hypothetical protein PC120_g11192 [Phytophthora cactorum]KAG3104087.1 hypothetical protein PC121_g795 [Phytophthora cactorum]KAG4064129.1 hypothetical protein PC123_g991 [Phytophthora cactorum]
MIRSRIVLARISRGGLADMSSIGEGISGAPVCVLAILEQHKTFLRGLDDAVYTFHSPLVEGSVGQHTRHSLDHLRKPLELLSALQSEDGVGLLPIHVETGALAKQDDANELLAAQQQGSVENMVRYDIRDRHTPVEKDRHAAIEQIEQLAKTLRAVPQRNLSRPVHAVFMLSADGREFDFESTFSRELAFAVHHCIHHNALSKVLLRHHFPELSVPDGFGMAPSTANFNLTHPHE